MRKVMRRSLSSAPSFSFPDTPRLFTRCTLSATPTNAPYILLATGRFLVFFVHTREIVPENGILSYSEAVFTAMNLPNFSVKVDISYDLEILVLRFLSIFIQKLFKRLRASGKRQGNK